MIFKNGYDGFGFEGDIYAVFSDEQITVRYGRARPPIP